MATASDIRVRLPAAFRAAAGGRAEVRVQGRTVGEALAALCRAHPDLAGRLIGPDGVPRRYVSLFVNDEDARQLGGAHAPLEDGDELTIVPALSGGAALGAGAATPVGVVAAASGSREYLDAAAVAEIATRAEESPDAEICGFVLGARGGGLEVWPARNIAPRAARAFAVDPVDVVRTLRRADEEGRALVALYHSHPAGGAQLSAADAAQLTAGGAPLLPGAELWIIGLERGRAVELRAYGWATTGYAERARWRGPFTARECRGPLGGP